MYARRSVFLVIEVMAAKFWTVAFIGSTALYREKDAYSKQPCEDSRSSDRLRLPFIRPFLFDQ